MIKAHFSKRQERDLGFQYIEAFCREIEVYLDSVEGFNPKVFEYRDAYLRYAIERYLYFAFVNNRRLYCSFGKSRAPGRVPVDRGAAGIEANLAFHLSGKDLSAYDKAINLCCGTNLEAVFSYARLLRWRWDYSFLARISQDAAPGKDVRADILIYVSSEKFVRYLFPITKILPFSFAYFIDKSNRKITDFLISQKLPFIDSADLSLDISPGKNRSFPKELSGVRHLLFWYDCLYAGLNFLKPRCVIVCEGNAPGDELMNQACKSLAVPAVCLQHGWSPIIHNGFRNMSYAKMLVWGDGFSESLKSYNPKQKFIVCGSHVVKLLECAKTAGNGPLPRAVCFFLQVPTRLISKKCWDEFFNLMIWTSLEFKDVPVIVREFPAAGLTDQLRKKLNKYPNITIKSARECSLMEVLRESRVSVAICSSTTLESIACGVLPIIFNMTSLPRFFPDIEAAGAGLEVKSVEAAQKAIKNCLADAKYLRQFDSGMKLFQERYFYKNDGKAAERIVHEIASVIRN